MSTRHPLSRPPLSVGMIHAAADVKAFTCGRQPSGKIVTLINKMYFQVSSCHLKYDSPCSCLNFSYCWRRLHDMLVFEKVCKSCIATNSANLKSCGTTAAWQKQIYFTYCIAKVVACLPTTVPCPVRPNVPEANIICTKTVWKMTL